MEFDNVKVNWRVDRNLSEETRRTIDELPLLVLCTMGKSELEIFAKNFDNGLKLISLRPIREAQNISYLGLNKINSDRYTVGVFGGSEKPFIEIIQNKLNPTTIFIYLKDSDKAPPGAIEYYPVLLR